MGAQGKSPDPAGIALPINSFQVVGDVLRLRFTIDVISDDTPGLVDGLGRVARELNAICAEDDAPMRFQIDGPSRSLLLVAELEPDQLEYPGLLRALSALESIARAWSAMRLGRLSYLVSGTGTDTATSR